MTRQQQQLWTFTSEELLRDEKEETCEARQQNETLRQPQTSPKWEQRNTKYGADGATRMEKLKADRNVFKDPGSQKLCFLLSLDIVGTQLP